MFLLFIHQSLTELVQHHKLFLLASFLRRVLGSVTVDYYLDKTEQCFYG